MTTVLLPALVNGHRVRWCRVGHLAWYRPGQYGEHRGEHSKRAHRPDRPDFADRNTTIAARVAEGLMTMEDIGDEFGITRERVRQIAEKRGVSREGIRQPARQRVGWRVRCPQCNERVPHADYPNHRQRADHKRQANGKLTNVQVAQAVRWYEAGWGYVAIGKAIGINFTSVKQWIVQAGVAHHAPGHYDRSRIGKLPEYDDEYRAALA